MKLYQFLEAFQAGSLLEWRDSVRVVNNVFGVKASHWKSGNKIAKKMGSFKVNGQ
jgi:hypothetical protein